MKPIILAILTLLIFALLGACVDDPRNPPGPVASATDGNHDDTGLEPPADSSGGGDQCIESWSVYQCRGLIIPYYRYMNGGSGTPIFFEGIDPDGAGPMPAQDPYICSDDIFVVGPDADPNSNEIRKLCRAKCDEEKGDLQFPPSIGPYNFTGTVECVFEDNSNDGQPTSPDPVGPGNDATCPWIDANPEEDQNLFDRSAEPADCASVSCAGWNPDSWISWSFNTGTKTHTTIFPGWFLDDMADDSGARLYVCDKSRFYDSLINGAPKGWIYAVADNDVLYRMGFRTGDYKLTVQRAGSSSNPVYPLDTVNQRVYAMDELSIGGSFIVRFRRPKTGGGYDSHTMNLTLPAY